MDKLDSFQIGDRVMVSRDHLGSEDDHTGEIAGVAWAHLTKSYIVLLYEPLVVPGYDKAVPVMGSGLRRLG